MTEAEWKACTNPELLLEFLQGRASDRKLRLAAVACCRRAGDLLTEDKYLPDLLSFTERMADSTGQEIVPQELSLPDGEDSSVTIQLTADGMAALAPSVPYGEPNPYFLLRACLVHKDSWLAGYNTISNILFQDLSRRKASAHDPVALPYLVEALLDIFGNPFRPLLLESGWLTWNGGTIPRLAQAAYELRRWSECTFDIDRLAVLADALEDAGCTEASILDHLRGPGPHYRGCWAVDLLLQKD